MNTKEQVWEFFHVWLRYQISWSDKGAMDWLVLHNLWGDNPIKAGEKYTKASENLFNFVWAADTEAINSTFELEIIESLENIELFKRFFVNLDEQGEIVGDKKVNRNVQKFFEEIIIQGREYTEQKWEKSFQDSFEFEEVKEALNSELNENETSLEVKAGVRESSVSQKDIWTPKGEDQNKAWSVENIILSNELLHIVKSKKILSKLENITESLFNKNKNTIHLIIVKLLKRLRYLYFVWLKETWSKRIGNKKIRDIISSFTNRRLSEVNLDEDTNQHTPSEVTSESQYEEPDLSKIDIEINHREIFQKWMNYEANRIKSRIPPELLKMMNKITEHETSNNNGLLSEEITNLFETLNNRYYYDFLQGNYNEDLLIEVLIKAKLNWKQIKRIIKNVRIEIEEKIIQCFVKLSQISTQFKLSNYAFVLSKCLFRRKGNALEVLKNRIAKSNYFLYGQHKEFHFRHEWNKAISVWESQYMCFLRNYWLWGICFIILQKKETYLKLDKSELNLLKRLWSYEQIFNSEGIKTNWVKELKGNRLFKEENNNAIVYEEDRRNPIGFSIWDYWKTSFRNFSRYMKLKDDKVKVNYNRKDIINVELDFKCVPEVIKNVPYVYLDYIQMGIVYSKPTFQNSLWMMMITGNTSFRLSNGSLGNMKKLGLRKLKKNSSSERKVLEAVEWLKENNHLCRTYLTNYESNVFVDSIDEINTRQNIQLTDDYYIVDEIDVDRKLQTYRVFEILNRKYAYSKEMFGKLQENIKKRKEIRNNWLLFYDDPYLEEKLFVHLFPYGTGGYNSTFSKIMDFSHYVKMRLLWGYTDRFRRDKEYIFFLYDWSKKKQIYLNNHYIQRMKIGDKTDKFDIEDELIPIKSEKDYFKKLGASVPQNLRYSFAYKRNRYYEAQTLLYNFGIPNLFVTVRIDSNDEECQDFVQTAFKLNENVAQNCKNNAIEYSLYFNRKIQFIRSHLKQKTNCNIFGMVIAYWDTIEYTSSGIPHLHALLWLSEEYRSLATIEHNKFVWVKRRNPRSIADDELNKLIDKYQTHHCLREKWNTKKNGEISNYCLNGYPFKPVDNDWIEGENGRIYYKRDIEDEYIVPYNPELLKLVKWHTNVQIVTSDIVAVYISKYITKVNRVSIPKKESWNPTEMNEEEFSEVEKYFKERKIGLLEAWNDLLSLHHYKNSPSINNFYITTPSDRIWKLIPTKDIKILIQQKKQKDEEDKDKDDGFLMPSAWENYMCRSEELEDITFPEMLTKYRWWSRFELVPKNNKKGENSSVSYWKQQPYKKFYQMIKEKSKKSSGSSTIDAIIAAQLNVSYNKKWHKTNYCFKRRTNILLNWRYKFKEEKDELFWFIELIDREPFRFFDELLTFEGKHYESFFNVWTDKGYWREARDKEDVIMTRYDIGGLEKAIHGISTGKVLLSFEDIKIIIIRLIQTIQSKNDEISIKKLKDLSLRYYNSFPLLFNELEKYYFISVKNDPIKIFKKELNLDGWWKLPFIIKWSFLKSLDYLNDDKSEWELVWSHFHRYAPIITESLNKNLETFLANYNIEGYYSNSQKRIIDFFIQNLFDWKRNCYFITGYAGCGKSFLLRELVFLFREVLNLNVLVWGTTGTAAKNINGQTIHRAFNYNSKNVWSMPQPGSYHFENLKKQDVIIIDEISMMTGEMLEFIDQSLRNTALYSRYRLDSYYKPFGGKMVILFGDLLQIPWVQEEIVGVKIRRYRKINDALIFRNFIWLFLKEQKRQEGDSKYYEYWKLVAQGNINEEVTNWLRTKVCPFIWNTSYKSQWLKTLKHKDNISDTSEWKVENKTNITWVTATNDVKKSINEKRLRIFINNKEPIKVYRAIYYCRSYELKDSDSLKFVKDFFSDDYIHEEELILAKGARAILNINLDVKAGLTNGTIGVIKDLEENVIHFEYEFKGQNLVAFIIRTEKDETIPFMNVKRCQFPLSLWYWLTMHKCQGQTLDGVVIDWEKIKTEGLFYSILARWRDSKRIHIKNLIVKEHIRTSKNIVELFIKKEAEFDEYFWKMEERFGDIGDLKELLRMIRETKISWAVLDSFLRKHAFGDDRIEDRLPESARELGNKMFWSIRDKVIERENWMLLKYREFIHEDNDNPDLDWRWEIGYDAEELKKNLLAKQYGDEVNDEESIEIDSDTKLLIDEIEEEVKNMNKDDDMEVDIKIHNFQEDEKIPWSFYNPEAKGFDSLLLLFYYKIYWVLNFEQKSYFSVFNPIKNINTIRYNGLHQALKEISKINVLAEYTSEERWKRLQWVIFPWISKLKNSDRIESQLDWFEYSHNLFVIKFKKSLTWLGKCKQNQNSWIIEDRSTVINFISIREVNTPRCRILNIDDNILKNSIMLNLFEKWPNCGSRMVNIEITQTYFPNFIWIVNNQQTAISKKNLNNFNVNESLMLGVNKIRIYNLCGIIFKANYKYSCWLKLYNQREDLEEWFSYDGEKWVNMLEKRPERFGKALNFCYNNENRSGIMKWPVIFLYKKA